MNIKDIPVVAVGPGSQPGESDGAELQYIDMPRGMSRYEEPSIPDPGSVANLTGAKAAMGWLQQALDDWQPGAAALADISALDGTNRELVNQILGEGEVAVKYTGDFRSHTQESVLAGVWRTFYFNADGKVTHDLLEVAEAPFIARLGELGRDRAPGELAGLAAPDDVPNARALLTEIAEQAGHGGDRETPHVINLTLLPMSPEELAWLDEALGKGPVEVLSRGYGNCTVASTRVRDVWWVRFYNSTYKLILNSIEITGLPAVVQAAPEDLRASAKRLSTLLKPYWAAVNG